MELNKSLLLKKLDMKINQLFKTRDKDFKICFYDAFIDQMERILRLYNKRFPNANDSAECHFINWSLHLKSGFYKNILQKALDKYKNDNFELSLDALLEDETKSAKSEKSFMDSQSTPEMILQTEKEDALKDIFKRFKRLLNHKELSIWSIMCNDPKVTIKKIHSSLNGECTFDEVVYKYGNIRFRLLCFMAAQKITVLPIRTLIDEIANNGFFKHISDAPNIKLLISDNILDSYKESVRIELMALAHNIKYEKKNSERSPSSLIEAFRNIHDPNAKVNTESKHVIAKSRLNRFGKLHGHYVVYIFRSGFAYDFVNDLSWDVYKQYVDKNKQRNCA